MWKKKIETKLTYNESLKVKKIYFVFISKIIFFLKNENKKLIEKINFHKEKQYF